MTVKDLLDAASRLTTEKGADATPWDSRILLAHVLGAAGPLALDPGSQVAGDERARFETLWGERLNGVPVQHLLREWDFYGRTFFVDSRALVPASCCTSSSGVRAP